MNKSEIRKKILKIRKRNHSKVSVIDYKYINKILLKRKIKKKSIGGYYPYNFEVDLMEILTKFEKQNL